MSDLLWLIPAFPLAGFLLLVAFGRRLGEPGAGWLAALMPAASFVVTAVLFLDLLGRPSEERVEVQTLFSWMTVGGLKVDLGFLADPLSVTMALFVTGIGALIHVYAIGYMHGDPKFSKFFLYLNLFVFSMLMLVLGDNLLVTFLGWEGVGVCSYFLISFWFTRESAATAGKKAFVTNRIGDFGFMLAIFLVWSTLGHVDYLGITEAAGALSNTTATAIALLLLVGAAGKSAQLPLYVWLPDAMEGPTPVSALIHAATMVTAGVYLLTRMSPVLFESSSAGTVIAVVGAATALFAATAAVAQNDIKKVLAYSTVSQLGFMFLAVGSGAYVAAVFHMVTHAFFKALMFLGSGSVIHGMHDEQDMRRMGALRALMPITAATFIVGWLAIAGVPPFSGFWSKDEILLYAWGKSPVLWAVGIVTAILTAYYMTRQVLMVFFTEPRWKQAEAEAAGAAAVAGHHEDRAHGDHGHRDHGHGGGEPHESSPVMWLPLVVLAVFSAVAGFVNLPFSKDIQYLGKWLSPVTEEFEATTPKGVALPLAIVATLAALAGIAAAVAVYQLKKAKPIEPAILEKAWGIDQAYAAFMGGPGRRAFDWLTWVFDRRVIDGAVNGIGTLVRAGGGGLRRLQSGYVRNYALGVVAGAILLFAWFIVRGLA